MKTHRIKKIMFAGISAQTNNKNELDETTAEIPVLWDDYVEKNINGKTLNKSKDSYLYGVYSSYESDVNGDFTVTIAQEVTKNKNAIVVENQKYLVFKKEGELPEIVAELWAEIWEYFEKNNEYTRSYTVDFEKYLKEKVIEIYISIND
ncbi:MAG: GyrI-like domain-containing protein [Campylobacterales bacterium]|nr:GyrI-like domain-containing protein [Campylobacterales bacterium]NQY52872.1 GyrI-like domain-containing protein [Campylobacteraceae bacterium]